MNKLINAKIGDNKTSIIIKKNYVLRYINKISKLDKKIFCIIDKKLKQKFNSLNNKKNVHLIFISGKENIKSFYNFNKLSENLISKKIDRKSVILAIGGGTIGDLSGFVASTILRGVDLKLIPTTLLSQVDSSIGGKNGINSIYGKNFIGTFYHPSEVIIDINFLKSLPNREIKSGYAEILKHALIKDNVFFNWLDKNYNKIFKLETKFLEKAIIKSILIKLNYVLKDTNEKLLTKESRAMLNYGHSFGHAIEAYYGYSNKINHGEAISVGMIIEAKISNILGFLSSNKLAKILDHFSKTKLKTTDTKYKSNEVLKILFKDKKNFNNKINLVLLKDIGSAIFVRNINKGKIKQIVKKL